MNAPAVLEILHTTDGTAAEVPCSATDCLPAAKPAAAESLGERPAPPLRRSLPWAVGGEAIYAAAQWGLVVALAKLGTPEMVGQLAFGFAVTAPVLLFANLQLRALRASDGRLEQSFADYFTLRLLTSAGAFVFVVGLALLLPGAAALRPVLILVGLWKAVEALSDLCHGELQRRARMQAICWSLVLRGVLTVTAVVGGISWSGRLAPTCLGFVLVALLVLLAVDLPCAVRGGGPCRPIRKSQWQPQRQLLLRAWPLGVAALLISLTVSLPRYFLEWSAGERTLGIYAALASLMQASTLLAAALGAAASGRLGTCYAAGSEREWRLLLARLLGLGLLLGGGGFVVALLGGPLLLTAFYSAEYASYQPVFCWLMLATVGTNLAFILNWAVLAARYVRSQLGLHVVLLLVTALGCSLLIPRFGLLGAAWSVGITNVCQLLGNLLILRHALRSLRTAQG